ncbi:MAG TPA: branched-chain amino acid ABC transporter permease [Candidatus Baltobacteraceae bacterium]|nr:branched-chain amino acid ABC transporter permease [Candidatus Baltobacteraceae bacterium]
MGIGTQIVLQDAVNGLLLGGVYAAVAVGFSLVWGVLNVVNLAHGALVMLGAYATYWFAASGHLDPLATLPVVGYALFLFGYGLQRFVINRVIGTSFLVTFLLTFGLQLLITNLALAWWTADVRSVTTAYSGWALTVGAVVVPAVRLVGAGAAVLMAAALAAIMRWTQFGMAVQATALDREAARLMGIPVARIYARTFALAAATAGMAGGLISLSFPIFPAMGTGYTLVAFVVCVLGGLGSVAGAVVGGFLLGLAQTFASAWVGPNYNNIVAFSALILMLVVRPAGLFGRAGHFRG